MDLEGGHGGGARIRGARRVADPRPGAAPTRTDPEGLRGARLTADPLVAVPIRSFDDAFRRLAPTLDPQERSSLARALAAHTVEAVRAAGLVPTVWTRDRAVVAWALRSRVPVATGEHPPGGLDGAALAAMAMAGPSGWIVLHADLPLLTPEDVRALAVAVTETGAVLAPSHDGGTSAIGARRPVRPSYGPGSFFRHLPRLPDARIVIRPGLAFDVDTPRALSVLDRRTAPPPTDRLAAR